MTRFNPNRLYKDTVNGKFMGVCAGIGDYFDVKPGVVRLLMIGLVVISGIFPVLLIYIVMGFALEAKPIEMREHPEEDQFWKQARTKPDYTKVDLRKRYESIEARTRNLEAYMTSKQFRLQRQLRELED